MTKKPLVGLEIAFRPSHWGGKDWLPAAYNPTTRHLYIPANERLVLAILAILGLEVGPNLPLTCIRLPYVVSAWQAKRPRGRRRAARRRRDHARHLPRRRRREEGVLDHVGSVIMTLAAVLLLSGCAAELEQAGRGRTGALQSPGAPGLVRRRL
jgi:hypothetical protein